MGSKYWAKRGNYVSVLELNGTYIKLPKYMVTPEGKLILPSKLIKFLTTEKNENKESINEFTVAYHPGFACNLSCSYCYQLLDIEQENTHGNRPSISKKLLADKDKMSDFISSHAKKVGFKSCSVTYLGGEPMIYQKDILNFHNSLSKKIDINHSSIVTNSSLITSKSIKFLSDISCNLVQITFDGDAENHNFYRHTKNGKGTYNQVIESINILQDAKISVSVRVNITSKNISSIKNLLIDLKNMVYSNKFSIYFALIDDMPWYSDDSLRTINILNLYANLHKIAISMGFNVTKPAHQGNCSTCRPPHKNISKEPEGIVISSDGILYSCWDSAGKKDMSVGNILNGYTDVLNSKCWVQCGYLGESNASFQKEAINLAHLAIYDKLY